MFGGNVASKRIKTLEKDMESMHLGITAAFTQIKEELTEHLDSINQNTSEFDLVHQRLNQLENMIEKVAERIDTLSVKNTETDAKIKLSLREQEYFLSLYTSTEVYSASEFARYLSLTEELVHALTHKLISKGIPVLTEHDEIGRVCYRLDETFRKQHALQGIVQVHPEVVEQFQARETDIDF